MGGLFITATGTEIGKTFVTAALCHQVKTAGEQIHALKPVISGIADDDFTGTDTAIIAEALGMQPTTEVIEAISPFRYKAPLAPAMAAALEGKKLNYDALISCCREALGSHPNCLIEGVGGSFVPLTPDKLVADWIKDLELASVVVAGSYLGTLSHITATLEAMAARDLPVKALIISESAGSEHPNFEETVCQAASWTDIPVIAIPRLTSHSAWKLAPDLTSVFR